MSIKTRLKKIEERVKRHKEKISVAFHRNAIGSIELERLRKEGRVTEENQRYVVIP